MPQGLEPAMVREEVARFFLGHLPSQSDAQAQQESQVNQLQHYLREVRGFPPDVVKASLPAVMDELHRLIVAGVVRPGQPESYELPWLRVTQWGEEVLKAEGPPVYDPDGYLDHVMAEVPDLPGEAALYLGEAVSAFNLGRTLSAAVMLGVAAEAVTVHLIESLAGSQHAKSPERLLKSLHLAPISQTHEEFTKQLDKDALPAELRRDLDVYIGNVLNFIRMTRNEAGHPTGIEVEPAIIEAQLRAFEGYAKRLCALAEHFASA